MIVEKYIFSVRCWWEALSVGTLLGGFVFGTESVKGLIVLCCRKESGVLKGSCVMGGANYRIERSWREKVAAFSLISILTSSEGLGR